MTRSFIKGAAAASLAGFMVLAAAPQGEAGLLGDYDAFDLRDATLGEDSMIDIGGWTQWGFTTDSTGLFNDRDDSLRNHQTWFYIEKAADGSDGLDWGFRADVMYGGDAQDTQAFGNSPGEFDIDDDFVNGDDGFAIPQLYLEVASGDWSVVGGHFYTLVGYEVVTAPDNFFFSHAFTMYLSEPFTHTGVLATYSGIDKLTLYGGWTAGWDTGFDQFDGGSSFLGGFSYDVADNFGITYITTFGNLGANGDGYSHSIVASYDITDSINYVFQSDFVDTDSDVLGTGFDDDYQAYGINNYLTWWATEDVGLGLRAEWWEANDVSYFEVTAGTNLVLLPNLKIRPEIRFQQSENGDDDDGAQTPDNPVGLPLHDGLIFAMDAIVEF